MTGPTHVSGLLSELLDHWEAPRRHPVVRSGDRNLIPWVVRLSVARRDGFHCRHCGWHMAEMVGMELDHILPWSAGGGDHSANLRTLCSPCNQKRSNWDDGDHEREMVPTTWWCQTCWLHPEVEAAMESDYLDTYDVIQRHPRPIWKDGTNLGRVPWVREFTTLAYCAWCSGYGYTDQAFTREQQDVLARLATPTDERPAR